MNNSKDDLVKVFVLPPSIEELERRLKKRKQDDDEIIQKRMSKASDEMSHYPEYDYILVNDEFDNTVQQILNILNAERLKNHRQIKTQKIVKNLRGSL
jgi:guanylate kinase